MRVKIALTINTNKYVFECDYLPLSNLAFRRKHANIIKIALEDKKTEKMRTQFFLGSHI
jgi:hypothetical protein